MRACGTNYSSDPWSGIYENHSIYKFWNASMAVQNFVNDYLKKVMQGFEHAGILAAGLFAWLFGRAY